MFNVYHVNMFNVYHEVVLSYTWMASEEDWESASLKLMLMFYLRPEEWNLLEMFELFILHYTIKLSMKYERNHEIELIEKSLITLLIKLFWKFYFNRGEPAGQGHCCMSLPEPHLQATILSWK